MIHVESSIAGVRQQVAAARSERKVIGLVPTMGALHEGHARLIEVCRAECGFVVVSIFVNPTQFGPHEDFRRYPRTLDRDSEISAQAGADLIFAPTVEAMYPAGEISTYVEVGEISRRLEGASRPGHFRGVATVVLKLFGIVRPDVAFFGEKDFQQQLVIRQMVEDLNVPVTIRTVGTVREADGLALSSRNQYLNSEERKTATVLSRALERAKGAIAAGEADASRVRQVLRETIESERLAQLDYAAVADAETLESLDNVIPGRRSVALLAVRVGNTRLIDNAILTNG